MQIFQANVYLIQGIKKLASANKTIGFVPTMGALHEGHLSLIGAAKKQCDIIVVSIFVNPTQFNNKSDFDLYPKHVNQDIETLIKADVDVLFLPIQVEIYPENYVAQNYNLENLEQVFEGEFRPNHFQGVCQIVDLLLQLIKPTKIFMGQKDYQQCLVVKHLIALKNFTTDLIICPIIREANGLAMSSRNAKLSIEQRQEAKIIYACLQDLASNVDVFETKRKLWVDLFANIGIQVSYLACVDAKTLKPITTNSNTKIILIAVIFQNIRLIDNVFLKH